MIRKQNDQLQWLEFELLAEIPRLVHGVLLRQGGFSQNHFRGLNLSKMVGDHLPHVEANLNLVKSTFCLPILFSSRLNHGNDVISVAPQMLESCPLADGMITSHSGIGLLNTHADCQAAIFYDPIHHALANVHCGWRGSTKNIYAAVIQQMEKVYNSRAENLLVCISPSLGPQSAEFIHFREELPESFWPFQPKANMFDFWAISEWQLKEAGVLSDHIQIAGIDTFANPVDYFSYRRDKITGRQGTVACLLS